MGVLQLGLGLFLFMRGAPHLTAAQVGLLTLFEVILAPIWVWLAFRRGARRPVARRAGAVVLAALVVHSALSLRRSKPPVGMAYPSREDGPLRWIKVRRCGCACSARPGEGRACDLHAL